MCYKDKTLIDDFITYLTPQDFSWIYSGTKHCCSVFQTLSQCKRKNSGLATRDYSAPGWHHLHSNAPPGCTLESRAHSLQLAIYSSCLYILPQICPYPSLECFYHHQLQLPMCQCNVCQDMHVHLTHTYFTKVHGFTPLNCLVTAQALQGRYKQIASFIV